MNGVFRFCCCAHFGAQRLRCEYPGRRSFLALPWAGLWLGLRPAAAGRLGRQAGVSNFVTFLPVSSTMLIRWAGLWLGLRPAAAGRLGRQAGVSNFVTFLPVSSTTLIRWAGLWLGLR